MEKDAGLREKIVLKLGLYCSGNHSDKATLLSLEQSKVSLDGAERLYYRRGHWRGCRLWFTRTEARKLFPIPRPSALTKTLTFLRKEAA